jgi:hypothetical protein
MILTKKKKNKKKKKTNKERKKKNFCELKQKSQKQNFKLLKKTNTKIIFLKTKNWHCIKLFFDAFCARVYCSESYKHFFKESFNFYNFFFWMEFCDVKWDDESLVMSTFHPVIYHYFKVWFTFVSVLVGF